MLFLSFVGWAKIVNYWCWDLSPFPICEKSTKYVGWVPLHARKKVGFRYKGPKNHPWSCSEILEFVHQIWVETVETSIITCERQPSLPRSPPLKRTTTHSFGCMILSPCTTPNKNTPISPISRSSGDAHTFSHAFQITHDLKGCIGLCRLMSRHATLLLNIFKSTHTHLKNRNTEGGVGVMGDGTCYIIVAIGCVDMKRKQLSKRYRSPFVGNESLSNQEWFI